MTGREPHLALKVWFEFVGVKNNVTKTKTREIIGTYVINYKPMDQ